MPRMNEYISLDDDDFYNEVKARYNMGLMKKMKKKEQKTIAMKHEYERIQKFINISLDKHLKLTADMGYAGYRIRVKQLHGVTIKKVIKTYKPTKKHRTIYKILAKKYPKFNISIQKNYVVVRWN